MCVCVCVCICVFVCVRLSVSHNDKIDFEINETHSLPKTYPNFQTAIGLFLNSLLFSGDLTK